MSDCQNVRNEMNFIFYALTSDVLWYSGTWEFSLLFSSMPCSDPLDYTPGAYTCIVHCGRVDFLKDALYTVPHVVFSGCSGETCPAMTMSDEKSEDKERS